MPKNDLLLRAARRERTERTPVWLMRQAGRTDPAYRDLRDRTDLPLETLFRDADLAAEITLQPKRLGVDALILFQDILTLLTPMGAEFLFRPGPELRESWPANSDASTLRSVDPPTDLEFIGRAIRTVQRTLDGELPLLGFAGAPLTLAFFLIEGASPGARPARALAFLREQASRCHALLDVLTDATIAYLRFQIESGVDAVQLFESVADLVTPQEYATFAHPYHTRIFAELGHSVPTILFAKEQPDVGLMVQSGADVLSVGGCVDLASARREFGDRVAFQGNVSNSLVATGSVQDIDEAVRRCVEAGGRQGHILNLNHGLLKDTPFANVQRLIETTRRASAEATPPVATRA